MYHEGRGVWRQPADEVRQGAASWPVKPQRIRIPCRRPRRSSSFPTAPGVYLMKDAQGRRPLRRQGQEPAQPGRALLHQGRRRGPAHRRPGQADRRHRLRARRQRGRRPAAGGPAGQGHPAALQRRAEGRQVVPLPADSHPRGFPARRVHAQRPGSAASSSTARSPAPRACASAIQVLQRIFQFRTCSLDINADDSAGAGSGRACCTASASAPPRATSASPRRSTASRSARCAWCWKARRTG